MSNNSETYSNEPFGRPRRRAKRTFLGALFVIVLLAVTISLCVALVILPPMFRHQHLGH